jgi:hypothetical protein
LCCCSASRRQWAPIAVGFAGDDHRHDPNRAAGLGFRDPVGLFALFSIDVVVLYLSFKP